MSDGNEIDWASMRRVAEAQEKGIPEGEYDLLVTGATAYVAKSSGAHGLRFTIEVESGPHRKFPAKYQPTITVESPGKFLKDLRVLGVPDSMTSGVTPMETIAAWIAERPRRVRAMLRLGNEFRGVRDMEVGFAGFSTSTGSSSGAFGIAPPPPPPAAMGVPVATQASTPPPAVTTQAVPFAVAPKPAPTNLPDTKDIPF